MRIALPLLLLAMPTHAATARLEDRASGRWLELLTTQPSVQVYTGNYFDGAHQGKHGRLYRMGDGVALEPGLPPDTPHFPQFGSARVDPGRAYVHVMVYCVGLLR